MRNARVAVFLAGLLLALVPQAARTAVSADDGYAPDGTAEWHFELAPYAWVPATSAHIKLGNGATANINAGMPTIADLRNILTGVFMGYGLVRYGPWSAELNIDYVSASQTKGLPPGPLHLIGRSLDVSTSLVRVSPGFGYEVYRGALGPVPATLDARIGFSYFTHSTTLDLSRFGPRGQRLLVSRLDESGSFVQPWLGFRGSVYPWPRWRFALLASVQGLGVDGGAWGVGGRRLRDLGGESVAQSHRRVQCTEQPGPERIGRGHSLGQFHRVRPGAGPLVYVLMGTVRCARPT